MSTTIEPEPSDAEREAILSVLSAPVEPRLGEWAATALVEGVEQDELDP